MISQGMAYEGLFGNKTHFDDFCRPVMIILFYYVLSHKGKVLPLPKITWLGGIGGGCVERLFCVRRLLPPSDV